ncbi:hypothetical protein Ccrd_018541 [Cynara cardunculus var. scolymus]|uniref:Uncharacterized protein n=1 Tax=Cynara cardunculus var. scolymus TaxID=59895 RepID=A0A103Y611_CYNCS|nr:hypothetical protein Ccrd_018541 [Cynara cardunculus var. scolymus]
MISSMAANLAQMGGSQEVLIAAYNKNLEGLISPQLLQSPSNFSEVHYKKHTPEKCLCTYLLVWQHGPEKGNIIATSIKDICLIMLGVVDPKVTDFAKIVKEKLGSDFDSSGRCQRNWLSSLHNTREFGERSVSIINDGVLTRANFNYTTSISLSKLVSRNICKRSSCGG